MVFLNNCEVYAKVWKVTQNDKYIDLQVTTSEKDKDGNYVNSSWFPRVIGHAFNSLKDNVTKGDSIKITKAKMSNERYDDNEGNIKSRFKFVILEAEILKPNEQSEGKKTASAADTKQVEAKKDDACPW